MKGDATWRTNVVQALSKNTVHVGDYQLNSSNGLGRVAFGQVAKCIERIQLSTFVQSFEDTLPASDSPGRRHCGENDTQDS